jgi:hypothetical protein
MVVSLQNDIAQRWNRYKAAIACGAALLLERFFQLRETTMDPSRRTLKQVTIDSAAEADRIFSMLMGDEVAPRREFIESHAKYAKIDV